MAIDFEQGWLQHSNDHLMTETLARRLCRKAAGILAQNQTVEARIWASGVSSDAQTLRITKGLHQAEGPLGDIMHITMALYTGRRGGLIPNTNFRGRFHLYTQTLPPGDGSNVHRLQPIRLSYSTVGHGENQYLRVDIPNAPPLSSDATSRE